jgi:elongation factor 1 alpha-like protein
LLQCGFQAKRLAFVPCSASTGENLVQRTNDALKSWYEGPTLIEQLGESIPVVGEIWILFLVTKSMSCCSLDRLDVPTRSLEAPLRLPVANVFRGQTSGPSGLGVSGRVESGIVQVGERLRVLPGDESGLVRCKLSHASPHLFLFYELCFSPSAIDLDGELVQWAAAGSNVTVFLTGIDPIYVGVGSVLCPVSHPVPLVSRFVAQIVVFDIKYPLTTGSSVS